MLQYILTQNYMFWLINHNRLCKKKKNIVISCSWNLMVEMKELHRLNICPDPVLNTTQAKPKGEPLWTQHTKAAASDHYTRLPCGDPVTYVCWMYVGLQ